MTSSVRTQSASLLALSVQWPMLSALMGGTSAMRAAGEAYLPKWPNEENGSYDSRLKVATLYPAFSYTVSVMAGKPFSKALQLSEDAHDDIVAWCDDIDLQGRNLHSFSAELLSDCIAYGLAGVLVDFPKSEAKTREDERKAGSRPYFTKYDANQILGFRIARLNGADRLTQLRLLEIVTEPDGEFGEKSIEQVRVLMPGTWQTWRKVEKKEDWILHEEGTTTLQEVPFVFFYGLRKSFGIGIPPLLELAHQNVEHWQSSSDQQTILHVARVPILTVVGAESDTQITVGASTAVKLPQGASMMFVEHSGAAIEAGRVSLQDLEERMRQTGAELLVLKPGQVTATQTRSENEANKCVLQRITELFEDGIDQCLQFMADWVNLPNAGNVQLFKAFAELPSDASMESIIKAVSLGLISGETALREFKRRGIVSDDVEWDDEQERIKSAGPSLGMIDAQGDETGPLINVSDNTDKTTPEPATVDLAPILAAIKAIPAQESVENVDYSPVLADLAKQITELSKKVDEPQEAEIDLSPINDSIAALSEKLTALESKPEQDDSAMVRQIVADAIKPLMDQVANMRETPEERQDIGAIVRAELAAMPKPSHQVMMLDPQTGAIKKQITLQYGEDGKATGATVEQVNIQGVTQ